MTRYLLVVAVLVGGCDQLKSPQKIHELEEKVDRLSDEVAALKGSGARGSGSGDQAGSGSGSEGSGSAAEGSGSAAGSGAGSGEAAGSAAAGDGSAAGDAGGAALDAGEGNDASPDAVDAGLPDALSKEARALADLRDVVSTMDGAKPGAKPGPGAHGDQHPPPARPAPPDALPWAYDGKFGPPTWGTIDPKWSACLGGKAQSPVDIEPRAGTASPITFHYAPTPAALFDDGRALRVNFGSGSSIEIDGKSYQLLQVGFHTPSEHTIAGEHYPLEAQLVHQDIDGKLVMISVLYDIGAASPALTELWSKWPRKIGGEDKLRKPFDPTGLLPDTRTVFRYAGSLTTPPCTEGVMWNVMRRVPTDSRANLEGAAGHHPHNIRELQAVNARKIE